MESERRTGALADVPAEWNRLTDAVLGAAMEVHSLLGPGLLERLYEEAFAQELALRQIPFQRQAPIRMKYKGVEIGDQCMDFLVGDLVVVELKAIDRVADVHLAQLVSYLRSSGKPLGLLINFHVSHLRDGIYRRVHSRNTPAPVAFLSPGLPPRSSAASAFTSTGEHQ
jgi:GxxExxY protein